MDLLIFLILSAGLLGTAAAVLIARNPIHSALYLVLSFLFLAGLYVQLDATFIAVIQVMVYAGAIMVLFLFVIMLLNLSDRELGKRKLNFHKLAGTLSVIALLLFFVWAIGSGVSRQVLDKNVNQLGKNADASIQNIEIPPDVQVRIDKAFGRDYAHSLIQALQSQGLVVPQKIIQRPAVFEHVYQYTSEHLKEIKDPDQAKALQTMAEGLNQKYREDIRTSKMLLALKGSGPSRKVDGWDPKGFGTVQSVGRLLFTRYLLPFEVTSVLLLAGILGAVVIAKRRA